MAANTIARWVRRDPASAFEFLHRYSFFTDAQVVAAARAAGAPATPRGRGDESLAEVMRSVAEWSGDGLNRDLPIDWQLHLLASSLYEVRCDIKAPEDSSGRFLGAEFELTLTLAPRMLPGGAEETQPSSPQDRLICAVFSVPKYVVLERYRSEARSLWARLVALSLVYPLVVAVFSGPAARRHFASAIPAEMRVSWTGQGNGTEEARRRCRSELVSFSPAPHAGIIILSTRPGLAVDLFEQARRFDVRPGHMPREWMRRTP
jgi:hypothetical protein